METFEQLNKKRDEILTQLKNIDKQIEDKQKRTIVQCTNNNFGHGCGMAFTIADLEYIQTHHYEHPHGCFEGDTWHEGEGNFICPSCGHRNRLYNRPELKYLFGKISKEYKR